METEEKRTTNAEPILDFGLGFPETDVTLIVEGQNFHVNRQALCQHSSVFDTLFKENTTKEIVLNKKAGDFSEFLRSFYPNMRHSITENNLLRVLPLAHEYKSSLVKDCEDFMVKMCQPETGITVSTLLDYILAAEKFDLTNFLDSVVNFCGRVDFELLGGKTFIRKSCFSEEFYESKDEVVHKKFLQLSCKVQLSIARKRIQNLEMYKRSNGKNVGNDYGIQLT